MPPPPSASPVAPKVVTAQDRKRMLLLEQQDKKKTKKSITIGTSRAGGGASGGGLSKLFGRGGGRRGGRGRGRGRPSSGSLGAATDHRAASSSSSDAGGNGGGNGIGVKRRRRRRSSSGGAGSSDDDDDYDDGHNDGPRPSAETSDERHLQQRRRSLFDDLESSSAAAAAPPPAPTTTTGGTAADRKKRGGSGSGSGTTGGGSLFGAVMKNAGAGSTNANTNASSAAAGGGTNAGDLERPTSSGSTSTAATTAGGGGGGGGGEFHSESTATTTTTTTTGTEHSVDLLADVRTSTGGRRQRQSSKDESKGSGTSCRSDAGSMLPPPPPAVPRHVTGGFTGNGASNSGGTSRGSGSGASNSRGSGASRGSGTSRGSDGVIVVEATRFGYTSLESTNLESSNDTNSMGGEYDATSNGPTIPNAATLAERLTTPTRSPGGLFGGDNSKAAASPGGYGMMDLLQNMHDGSPYKAKRRDDEEDVEGQNDDGGKEENEDDEDDGGGWRQTSVVLPKWLRRGLGLDDEEEEEEDVDDDSTTADDTTTTTTGAASTTNGAGVAVKEEPESQDVSAAAAAAAAAAATFDMPTQPPPPPTQTRTQTSQNQPPGGADGMSECTPKHANVTDAAANDDNEGGGMTVGIVDWSLKRRLKLECHPGRALPGGIGPEVVAGSEADVNRLAMNIFLSGNGGGGGGDCSIEMMMMKEKSRGNGRVRGLTEDTMVAARWKAAQMYWRHPAVYPLPKALLEGATTTGTSSTSASSNRSQNRRSSFSNPNASIMGPPPPRRAAVKSLRFASSTTLHGTEEEAAAIRSAADRIQKRRNASIRSVGFGSSTAPAASVVALMNDPAEFVRQRNAEWMEAFRSLYYAWMDRIDDLRLALSGRGPSARILDGIARSYFYVVSPTRTILFRCKLSSDNATIVPMIIISSTTSELRSKLRSMDVTLRILDGDEVRQVEEGTEGAVFEESIFDAKSDSKLSKQEEDEARKVQEELEALRRATAHGQTAGAEITVSMKKQKNAGKDDIKDSQIFRPLYMLGDEDCMAFYEFLLNTVGRLDSSSSSSSNGRSSSSTTDVPLLLHRGFGPTANASIECLSESGRRDDNYWDLKARREKENQSEHEVVHPGVTLEGPILPCAVRDLLHSSICHMILDKIRQNDGMDSGEDSPLDHVGSHYLVWTATRQEAQQQQSAANAPKTQAIKAKKAAKRMAYSMRETGEATSSLFNGRLDRWNGDSSKEWNEGELQVSTCARRQVLHMMIWNIESPKQISYATEVVLGVPGP